MEKIALCGKKESFKEINLLINAFMNVDMFVFFCLKNGVLHMFLVNIS